ncbi:hypothetical protein L1049_002984 [Liquidambar formosana]|uniref:Bifunctional inhibitor/plant lipid transfer protein/seed storage helical domain-containing protein n=1 Tax=Liquidambar formosana TaxID=63359 RepID=A0AAP0R8J7_LIQFO
MKKVSFVALCVVVVLLGEAHLTKAVTCSALELSSCLSAFTSSAPPSRMCCSKLREQRPCLCGYLKDPNLRQYVNSPNARRICLASPKLGRKLMRSNGLIRLNLGTLSGLQRSKADLELKR